MKNYEISITDKCNLDCVYCYPEIRNNAGKNQPKSLEELKKEIIRAKKAGYSNINFGCAESTLSPHLIALIKFCSGQDLTTSITTNGVALSRKGFLHELVSGGLSKIEFTFNSADEKINDKICRRKNTAKFQIKALRNIQNYNVWLSLITVISKLNYRYLEKHVDFLTSRFKFNRFSLLYVLSKKGWHHLLPKYSESEQYIINALDILNQTKSSIQIGNIPFCFLKKNEYYKRTLEYNGALPCPDPKIKKIIHKNCLRCALKSKCKGVNLPYYKVYGVSELEGRYFQ